MEKKKTTNNFLKPLGKLFKRFHLMIFFVFVIGCLVGAVIMINTILNSTPTDDSYTSTINAGTIDEATLNRLQSLHTSNGTLSDPKLPAGRTNPFAE